MKQDGVTAISAGCWLYVIVVSLCLLKSVIFTIFTVFAMQRLVCKSIADIPEVCFFFRFVGDEEIFLL